MKIILVYLTLTLLVSSLAFSQQIHTKFNMGPNVNSKWDEIAPVISADGKTLYICRQRHPENIGYNAYPNDQDIWYSEMSEDSVWSLAKNIGEPLNNIYPNAVCSVSPDGNTLLLLGNYSSSGPVGQGFSITKRTKDGWSFPQNLKIKNYENNSRYVTNFLCDNGKTMIMGLQQKDSYGKMDIYVSFLVKDDEWTEPMNLGPAINTAYEESSAFLASDGVTLYFSSMGHGGFGDADIFYSRRLDDTWKNWSEPKNCGDFINTSNKEMHFKIPASGDFAYFSSSDNTLGESDIFKVKVPPSMKPRPVFLVYGKVTDMTTKEPVDAKIYYETLPDGDEIGVANTNPKTGEYKITLPAGSMYGFRAEAKGFLPKNDNIDASDLNSYEEIERNLQIVPLEIGQTVVINNIFFEFAKSDIKPESLPELNRLVEFLQTYPQVKIEIRGHTDSIGSSAFNMKLSNNRAKAVFNFLINNGIDKKRLGFIGFGKEKPVADNGTDEGRQLNRRVEFVITDK